MAQELQIGLRQGLHITQQQLRYVELLEMNAPELDEAVELELAENPALAEADPAAEADRRATESIPYYRMRTGSPASDCRDMPEFSPADTSESLYDFLLTQIRQRSLDADVAAVAGYIVGNLDSNGYMQGTLDSIIDDLAYTRGIEVSAEVARKAFDTVRSLDPAGVGAENLRDCLLLQLERLHPSEERDNAIRIVRDQFEALHMRHSHLIIPALHITRAEVEKAYALIKTLNPKPGASYGGAAETAAGIIVPDYIVTREAGELYISLNNRVPELKVEESFAEAMRGIDAGRGRPKKGTEYVRYHYRSASDFISALRQRQQTMRDIMTAIVAHQREYFETGDVYSLRPMMLKDIEKATGYDKSVISRATNGKYVSTPWGAVMPVKSYFSDAVVQQPRRKEMEREARGSEERVESGDSAESGNGVAADTLTNRQIEAAIQELVDNEDKKHPLSDEKLKNCLLEMGYDVSRRTVAKYRDRKGILIARLRKQF